MLFWRRDPLYRRIVPVLYVRYKKVLETPSRFRDFPKRSSFVKSLEQIALAEERS